MAIVMLASTEKVTFTKEQLDERRIKMVQADVRLFDKWLRHNHEDQVVLRSSDLPEDARLRHVAYNVEYDAVMLFYWHQDWPIVPDSQMVPLLEVTMHQEVYKTFDPKPVKDFLRQHGGFDEVTLDVLLGGEAK